MNRPASLLIVSLVVFSWSAVSSPAVAQADVDSSAEHGTFARLTKSQAPRYPDQELQRGRQGWVKLSYVITTEGRAIDPVIEDSSGSRYFEKAALNVVGKWEFEPATWDGTPVEQCHREAMIRFAIDPIPTGVSRRFARRYKKIADSLNEGDIAGGEEMLNETFDSWEMTIYEVSRLWRLQAAMYEKKGDRRAQLDSLHKVIVAKGLWVEKDLYQTVLSGVVALELVFGDFSSAIAHYEELLESGATAEDHAELTAAVEYIRGEVAGEQLLAIPATVNIGRQCDGCTADWQYQLLRNQFSFGDVQGSLESFELRCDWKRFVDTPREGAQWEIPESWGSCRIIVYGDNGTSFSFLELPSTT